VFAGFDIGHEARVTRDTARRARSGQSRGVTASTLLRIATRTLVVLATLGALSGCASIAVSLASVGAGIGANHFIGSVQHRTFTEPAYTVRRATQVALRRMKFEVESIETVDGGELLKARTTGRSIEVTFEPLSANATRVKSLARHDGSVMLDSATAQEIVAQTERVLSQSPRTLQANFRELEAAAAATHQPR
jgi:hypothetical protein